MDDKRFGPENNWPEESELERYLNNMAKFQTVNYPQQFNTNDPWAGWYNSSVDLGAKWEEYYAQLEKMKATDETSYPVYEEPPPVIDPAQLMNNVPLGEGMYPFTPAPEVTNPDYAVDLYPSVGEETEVSLPEASDVLSPLEPPAIKEEAPEEQISTDQISEAQLTGEQITADQTSEDQSTGEQITEAQMSEQQTIAEMSEAPVAQEEKEEPTATTQQVIVWKNFPPRI